MILLIIGLVLSVSLVSSKGNIGNQIDSWTSILYPTEINTPPTKPLQPSGLSIGVVGNYYAYSSSAIDPEGDKIHYIWDFGDGWSCGTIALESGGESTIHHCWETNGIFIVKVQAMDEHGAESRWSDPVLVTVRDSPSADWNILNILFWEYINSIG